MKHILVKSVECPVNVPNEILCHKGSLRICENNPFTSEITLVRTVPEAAVHTSVIDTPEQCEKVINTFMCYFIHLKSSDIIPYFYDVFFNQHDD